MEDHPSIASSEGVSLLPAFVIYTNGSRAKEVSGDKYDTLESSIKCYIGSWSWSRRHPCKKRNIFHRDFLICCLMLAGSASSKKKTHGFFLLDGKGMGKKMDALLEISIWWIVLLRRECFLRIIIQGMVKFKCWRIESIVQM